MLSYILSVALCSAVAQAPKKVEFKEMQKVAVETIKDKNYPTAYRPFELKGKILTYDLSSDPLATKAGEIDPYEKLLSTLMLSEKVRQFGIPEMPREQTEDIARRIDGSVREATNKLNEGKLKGEDAIALADKIYGEAAETVQLAAEKHAQKNKLSFAVKPGIVPVLVATRPKGGVIHAMPEFQKRLLELRGKNPEAEVEQYSYSDTIPFLGTVFYKISWDNGKRKGKSSTTTVLPKSDSPFIFP